MDSSSRVIVRPARNIAGQVTLPGDKSISHRYAMLAAIADGTTRLENFSTGADCASTLACLRALGVKWERDGSRVTIQGCGPRLSEPVRTRDHGEQALAAFGAEVKHRGNEVRIEGAKLRAIEADIPGDISSAAFFLCAAALFPGSQVVIGSLLLNPTRARLLDILISMGVGISVTQLEEQHGELRGTAQVQGGAFDGATIKRADTTALIDEMPVLPAIAPYTSNGIEIRDARELRVKESDRIASLAKNLRAMGAHLEEREDGLKIPGGQKLHGAVVDSFEDHRIAMAFAVAALRAEGETKISRADAAVISYPGFFDTLESLTQR